MDEEYRMLALESVHHSYLKGRSRVVVEKALEAPQGWEPPRSLLGAVVVWLAFPPIPSPGVLEPDLDHLEGVSNFGGNVLQFLPLWPGVDNVEGLEDTQLLLRYQCPHSCLSLVRSEAVEAGIQQVRSLTSSFIISQGVASGPTWSLSG